MHINISQKTIYSIAVFILIVFSLILFVFAVQFFSYRKTVAVIADIQLNKYESISAESNSSKDYSITYVYTVNGATYKSVYTTFRKPKKKIGDHSIIRYNPMNPQKLFFGDKIVIFIIGIIFLLLLLFVMRKGYVNEKE